MLMLTQCCQIHGAQASLQVTGTGQIYVLFPRKESNCIFHIGPHHWREWSGNI